jgi:DUF1680 family protein
VPVKLALQVRIPYWATKDVAIRVNGKPQEITATPATYVAIDREWKDGDRVEVSLPMHLHTAPTADDPTVQAMMYGPLVLAGRMGHQDLSQTDIVGPSAPSTMVDVDEIADGKNPFAMPTVPAAATDDTGWIVAAEGGEPLQFATRGLKHELAVSPLYQILDERYTVYFKVPMKTA